MILMRLVDNFEQKSVKKKRGEGMEAVFITDRGKVRSRNEDNGGIFQSDEGILLLVADGMGGHLAGDVASGMALSSFEKSWSEEKDISTPVLAENWLKAQVEKANDLLLSHANQHPECKGMGTTIVVALCTERFTTIANIGDSRCYIYNENGFKQITEDHSLVNELVRTGQISREDAEHHPRKNVLVRVLGTEARANIDIRTVLLDENDYLLLCSDGLSNKISEQEMVSIIQKDVPLEEKGQMLVALANEHGGEDNITLVLLQFNPISEGGRNIC